MSAQKKNTLYGLQPRYTITDSIVRKTEMCVCVWNASSQANLDALNVMWFWAFFFLSLKLQLSMLWIVQYWHYVDTHFYSVEQFSGMFRWLSAFKAAANWIDLVKIHLKDKWQGNVTRKYRCQTLCQSTIWLPLPPSNYGSHAKQARTLQKLLANSRVTIFIRIYRFHLIIAKRTDFLSLAFCFMLHMGN